MRQAQWLVFDEYVAGGVLATTNQDLNSKLGQYDQLALQAVVDNVSSPLPTAFKVSIQHSSDGRVWMAKSAHTLYGVGPGSPEIGNTVGINLVAGQTSYFGMDQGTIPTLAFVQLTVSLTGAGTGAHVRLYVTARDWGGR